MNVVPTKQDPTAATKTEQRGEDRVFLCYFERHGIMDGSILTISLKSALTGGKLFTHRSRDFKQPPTMTFPLRLARDWQSWLTSAKLWTTATSAELRNEIDTMIDQGKLYVPKIRFETPQSLQSKQEQGRWEPHVSNTVETEPLQMASQPLPDPAKDADSDADGAMQIGSDCEKGDDEGNAADPVGAKALRDQLEIKETELRDLRKELEAAALYGGGFDASGNPVAYKSSSRRPRDQLPQFWDLATPRQKQIIENDLASKMAKLRVDIDKLDKELQALRANVALDFYARSGQTESVVIPSLKGFVCRYAGFGGSGGLESIRPSVEPDCRASSLSGSSSEQPRLLNKPSPLK